MKLFSVTERYRQQLLTLQKEVGKVGVPAAIEQARTRVDPDAPLRLPKGPKDRKFEAVRALIGAARAMLSWTPAAPDNRGTVANALTMVAWAQQRALTSPRVFIAADHLVTLHHGMEALKGTDLEGVLPQKHIEALRTTWFERAEARAHTLMNELDLGGVKRLDKRLTRSANPEENAAALAFDALGSALPALRGKTQISTGALDAAAFCLLLSEATLGIEQSPDFLRAFHRILGEPKDRVPSGRAKPSEREVQMMLDLRSTLQELHLLTVAFPKLTTA